MDHVQPSDQSQLNDPWQTLTVPAVIPEVDTWVERARTMEAARLHRELDVLSHYYHILEQRNRGPFCAYGTSTELCYQCGFSLQGVAANKST